MIGELTHDFSTAFNTGNYDQAATMFSADGWLLAPQHEPAQGRKSIEKFLREYGEAGYEDLHLETLQLDHSEDMAVQIGRYLVAIRQPNGTTVADRGKFLITWWRLGAWLMTANSWSTNLPSMK